MYHFRMNQLGNPHEYFIKNYYSFQNKNNINYQISFLYLLKYFFSSYTVKPHFRPLKKKHR